MGAVYSEICQICLPALLLRVSCLKFLFDSSVARKGINTAQYRPCPLVLRESFTASLLRSYVNQNVHQKPFATLSTACKYMCTCEQPWRAEESLLYLKFPYLILKSTMLKKWRYNQAVSFENQCIQLVYLWIREMCYLCPSEILSSLFLSDTYRSKESFIIHTKL